MSTTRSALVAEARCLQCARTAATIRAWQGGLALTALRPEHAESVRRRRCPWCLGNLRVESTEGEEYIRRPITPDELVPRRARPRKDATP